jgi:peroxiredoxin
MQKYLIALAIIAALLAGIFLLRSASRSLVTELTPGPAAETIEDEGERPLDATRAELTPAPHWELPDLAGTRVRLSDYLGRPLTITFWNTWHPLAVDQLAALENYVRDIAPCGAGPCESALVDAVTIVSQEDTGLVRAFARRGGYRVTILLDQSGAVLELYRAHAVPVTFFITRTGAVAERFIGVLSEEQLRAKAEQLLR